MKILKLWSLESISVGEHIHVPGVWYSPIPWRQKPQHSGPFQNSAYVPLHWAVHCILYNVVYNKLVNVNRCSSKFCKRFQQIIKSEEVHVGTPNFVAKSKRCVDTLGTHYLPMASKVRAVLWN